MPVTIIASQPRRVQADHQPGLVQPYFRDQLLEAKALIARGTGLAEIVIDDLHTFSWPAKKDDPFDKTILQLSTFLMVPDLPRGRLPHVYVSQLGPVGGRDPLLNRQ
jgi:hypothetical protein